MRSSSIRISCLVAVLAGVDCTGQAQPLTNVTTYATSPGSRRADRIPVHGVFELTLTQPLDYGGQLRHHQRRFCDDHRHARHSKPGAKRPITDRLARSGLPPPRKQENAMARTGFAPTAP